MLNERGSENNPRATGEQRIPVVVHAEREIAAMERIGGHGLEQSRLAARARSDKSELLIPGHRRRHAHLGLYCRGDDQETKRKKQPTLETQQVTPPKSFARSPSAAIIPARYKTCARAADTCSRKHFNPCSLS